LREDTTAISDIEKNPFTRKRNSSTNSSMAVWLGM
jgi:hypothetical protein